MVSVLDSFWEGNYTDGFLMGNLEFVEEVDGGRIEVGEMA